MPKHYDVIVIGLGGMGSTAAYQLATRGQRVLGLEQFGPAHDLGSSHGGSRIIRQAYFEDPAYVPLLLRAYELWEAIEKQSGEEILTVTGGLMMGPPDSLTVTGTMQSATQWNLSYEVLEANDIRKRYPVFTPSANSIAIYEEKAGFVRPELSVYSHLFQAEKHGADLRFFESAQSWEVHPSGEGVRVVTNTGTYEAGKLIISPGAWAPKLLAELGVSFQVERHIQMFFEPTRGIEPFRVGKLPIYIWEADDNVQLYGFPSFGIKAEGAKVAFFRKGQPCTPENIDRTVYEHEVEIMRNYLEQGLPMLNGRFLQGKTCMYTNTPDEHFVITEHPQHPQVVIAAGFSGHGFKFASVVGEILADLVIDGNTNHPIELFSPQRFVYK
ncbi:N-methyl-L-tryptophan oxidase [Bacillus canaveralius]|uniref:N-methyl-L-tryptophan oxidase n=1 Tax=Bacillus canaveralius TaxID=1403243 RepID=A0A2N5GJ87_9BACI|nr:N-methyl-L-tryptophan oxidase [Bacillus canaveralius]PLR81173.1 N-methyl-L-tryptophan oxidase [Bacillus canaveralius]PLR95854.1 N-methyl-L-tryptophan oxidase [Bacillus canaveralius]RSK50542.1 N-methyl-L-tryptophan oxidase [Bacillus canaveralius]